MTLSPVPSHEGAGLFRVYTLREASRACYGLPMTNPESIETPVQAVAWLHREGGWGARVRVLVAATPEADAAAAAFFNRASTLATGHAAYVDEEATIDLGPAMHEAFYPTCEHGLSALLCAGPGHYPADL